MTFCKTRIPSRFIALLLLLLLLSARTPARAEAPQSHVVPPSSSETPVPGAAQKRVAITTSLITPFFDAYYLAAKVRASNHVSLIVNASYLLLEQHDWRAKSVTMGLGADYYFTGDGLRGWYVEAVGELWLSSWRHNPSGEHAPLALGYAGIALAGYEFVFDAGPVIDLGVGAVAFHTPSARVEFASGSAASEATTKVYPVAKVEVGWAF